MQSAKEKISNMASVAKERLTICKAKVEEKAEKAAARTPEERDIAKERRKAKEAQAKMELHQAKAKHAAQKQSGKHLHHGHPGHQHHHPPIVGHQYDPTEPVVGTHANQTPPMAHQPVGTVASPGGVGGAVGGNPVPTYPPPGYKYP